MNSRVMYIDLKADGVRARSHGELAGPLPDVRRIGVAVAVQRAVADGLRFAPPLNGCIVSQRSCMSYGVFWILALLGMVALPQVLGLALSHLSRNEETRRWFGPAIAALVFGIGWYVVLNKPWRHLEYGKETCGAAGALFLVGLFVFVPANLMIGSAIQFVSVRRRTGQHSSPG